MIRALVVALLLAGCGEPPELSIFAASSTAEALAELEGDFERAHPDVDVRASFAGSQVLRLQIEQGAPADLFVSADREHVEALARAGLVAEDAVLAHNELVIIVPPENPAGIESFSDLPRARRLVIGDASVPVGRYTRAVLRSAGARFEADVLARVVSEESNVRLVRAKVELGEADAAIVYRTDAIASEGVRVVPIPAERNVRADYWVALVSASERKALAREWIALARGEQGARVLEEHGFTPP